MHAPQVVHAQAASGVRREAQQGMWTRRARFEGWQCPRNVVQFHALVDLKGGGAKRLTCGCGRADVLAAIALDAGIGIEQTRPGEILELVRTEQHLWLLSGLGSQVPLRKPLPEAHRTSQSAPPDTSPVP